MKENEVDIMHLNAIKSAFIDCDEERTGSITKAELIQQIADLNLKFPAQFLFELMYDMQHDPTDCSENASINLEHLKNIIEIYNNCPLFLQGDSNNSDNFKGSLDI